MGSTGIDARRRINSQKVVSGHSQARAAASRAPQSARASQERERLAQPGAAGADVFVPPQPQASSLRHLDDQAAGAGRSAVGGYSPTADEVEAHFASPAASLADRRARQALKEVGKSAGAFARLPANLQQDKAFVIAALRVNPAVVSKIGRAAMSDPDIVRVAVEADPAALKLAAPNLRQDPAIVLRALRRDAKALEHVAASLRKDRGFMRLAISNNPEVLAYADTDLRNDKAFLAPLLARSPGLGLYIGRTLARDVELAKRMVRAHSILLDPDEGPGIPKEVVEDKATMLACATFHGASLALMSERMQSDREVVLAAVRNDGSALRRASEKMRDDPEVVQAAVRNGPDAILHASPRLLADRKFISRLCAEDPRVALFLARPRGPKICAGDILPLKPTPESCIKDVLAAHPELEKARARLESRLSKAGIDCPERFDSYALLEQVLTNREQMGQPDGRPLAVYVYPKYDYNGAFLWENMTPLAKHYRVLYFEANTDAELANHIREATRATKASLLVIGGHGNGDDVALGAGATEKYCLGVGDGAKLRDAKVGDALAPNGTIILKSCSSGQGFDTRANPANLLATVFPQAHVYAPSVGSNNWLKLDARGAVINPGIEAGELFTYHVRPARPRPSSAPAPA